MAQRKNKSFFKGNAFFNAVGNVFFKFAYAGAALALAFFGAIGGSAAPRSLAETTKTDAGIVGVSGAKGFTGKPVDMYLLAGQSNAAGYSAKAGLTAEETFENVMYAGETDKEMATGIASSDFLTEFAPATAAGMGKDAACVGPEYGMASYLNASYSSENKAIIFKTAAGGTSLRNEGNAFGNWLPPSARENAIKANYTGYLYDLFLENFKTVYEKLVAEGYCPHIVGMAWMQGENDRAYPVEYKPLIKDFVADIRADLGKIVGENLNYMPFVIGEISETFYSLDETETIKAFNGMLFSAAGDMDNISVIKSGKIRIHAANGAVVGSDRWHWNANDIKTVGQLFAQKIRSLSAKSVSAADGENGTLSFEGGEVDWLVSNGKILLSPRADGAYRLRALTVNGAESAGSEKGYVAAFSGKAEIQVVFGKVREYSYTYRCDEEKGCFEETDGYCKTRYTEFERLAVRVSAFKGWQVDKVVVTNRDTYEQTELSYDAETAAWYGEGNASFNGVVNVSFKERVTSSEDSQTLPPESGPSRETPSDGCGGCRGGTPAVAALSLPFVSVVIGRRRLK